jgi:hypothetical protein
VLVDALDAERLVEPGAGGQGQVGQPGRELWQGVQQVGIGGRAGVSGELVMLGAGGGAFVFELGEPGANPVAHGLRGGGGVVQAF